jgi:hypothetical protein
MSRDPDLVNPSWERPPDWPYEADWDSPAWKRARDESEQRIVEARREYGFSVCPACHTAHTSKTVVCRECGHRAFAPPGSVADRPCRYRLKRVGP